jgi:hypothetical protein
MGVSRAGNPRLSLPEGKIQGYSADFSNDPA